MSRRRYILALPAISSIMAPVLAQGDAIGDAWEGVTDIIETNPSFFSAIFTFMFLYASVRALFAMSPLSTRITDEVERKRIGNLLSAAGGILGAVIGTLNGFDIMAVGGPFVFAIGGIVAAMMFLGLRAENAEGGAQQNILSRGNAGIIMAIVGYLLWTQFGSQLGATFLTIGVVLLAIGFIRGMAPEPGEGIFGGGFGEGGVGSGREREEAIVGRRQHDLLENLRTNSRQIDVADHRITQIGDNLVTLLNEAIGLIDPRGGFGRHLPGSDWRAIRGGLNRIFQDIIAEVNTIRRRTGFLMSNQERQIINDDQLMTDLDGQEARIAVGYGGVVGATDVVIRDPTHPDYGQFEGGILAHDVGAGSSIEEHLDANAAGHLPRLPLLGDQSHEQLRALLIRKNRLLGEIRRIETGRTHLRTEFAGHLQTVEDEVQNAINERRPTLKAAALRRAHAAARILQQAQHRIDVMDHDNDAIVARMAPGAVDEIDRNVLGNILGTGGLPSA